MKSIAGGRRFDISARGWDPPVFSLPAVALAAGKLMKLDPERLTARGEYRAQRPYPDGADSRSDAVGLEGPADAEAGRNAVFAALLARRGLTGPAPIFEGHAGFFRR
jgi:2-methylcitrate dehydratase